MINRVILVGRLGKDPEMKTIQIGENERQVVTFPLATHELITDKNGEKNEITEWHNIEMWDRNALNAVKILKKGRVVYIEGKIKTETWTDKEENKRHAVKIRASLFQVLSTLGNNPKADNNENDTEHNQVNQPDQDADNLSF
jgi:single-strand DNA-binding protein